VAHCVHTSPPQEETVAGIKCNAFAICRAFAGDALALSPRGLAGFTPYLFSTGHSSIHFPEGYDGNGYVIWNARRMQVPEFCPRTGKFRTVT
jgi:hypothetical protein